MSTREEILRQPHWQYFLHIDGLAALPLGALSAADDFLRFLRQNRLATPTSADIQVWCLEDGSLSPQVRLERLRRAMEVCIPDFVGEVDLAIRRLPATAGTRKLVGAGEGARLEAPASRTLLHIDPIAPPSRKPPRARQVSVAPSELPAPWQQILRRIFHELPGANSVMVAPSIAKRLREKLCQFAWSCRQAGLDVVLTSETITCYERDIRQRSLEGRNGLRWATVRASIEDLHRFARYAGLDAAVIRDLAQRYALLESRENMQRALKHFELARTGNTIDRLLDLAETLLRDLRAVHDPKKRHQLRNGAAILGIFANVPLRNASADLRFGETLFWEAGHWVVRMQIQKTRSRRPEQFVSRLEPEFGRYIDALILGDNSVELLPKLRTDAIRSRRQLFVLHDGSATAASYIPRIFKALSGNSFTTTRTMTHTECAIHYGETGVDMAMAACHQIGPDIRYKYQQESVAVHAVSYCRASAQARRADYATDVDATLGLSFLEMD